MKKIYTKLTTIIAIFALFFLYGAVIVFAVPPATQYVPGETLDPNCPPVPNTNCSVKTGWKFDIANDYIYNDTDFVGIGTATPRSQLTLVDDGVASTGYAATAVFNGVGADDFIITDITYTGNTTVTWGFKIITNGTPDEFEVYRNGVLVASNVQILAGSTPLSDGTEFEFGSTVGHTIGDEWTFTQVAPGGVLDVLGISDEQLLSISNTSLLSSYGGSALEFSENELNFRTDSSSASFSDSNIVMNIEDINYSFSSNVDLDPPVGNDPAWVLNFKAVGSQYETGFSAFPTHADQFLWDDNMNLDIQGIYVENGGTSVDGVRMMALQDYSDLNNIKESKIVVHDNISGGIQIDYNTAFGSAPIQPVDSSVISIKDNLSFSKPGGVGTIFEISNIGEIFSNTLAGFGTIALSADNNGNIIQTPSDEKLKTNIESLDDSLERVMQLNPVSYTWKDSQRFGDQIEIGFIAQEIENIVPEVVRSGGEYKSVNYQILTALNAGAIKDLAGQINERALKFIDNVKEIFVKKVTTEELCIGDVCFNEDEAEVLKDIIKNSDIGNILELEDDEDDEDDEEEVGIEEIKEVELGDENSEITEEEDPTSQVIEGEEIEEGSGEIDKVVEEDQEDEVLEETPEGENNE